MKLDNLRKIIDSVDIKILNLIAKRFKIAEEISLLKQKYNLPVQDKKREQKVYKNLMNFSRKLKIDTEFTKDLYRLIIKQTKKTEKKQ